MLFYSIFLHTRHQIILGASIILLTGILFTGCKSPTPSPAGVVIALQQMQELATTEYILTKVVKANDDQTWYKVGDRRILITCEARVKAGIDFSKLDTRYVSIKGKTISIQLPPPQIISLNLPPDKIRVAYQDIGYFRSYFSAAEQNTLMQQAEKQIQAKAHETGVLEDAKINARTWLSGYLVNLGFETIDIQFDAPIKIINR